MRAPLILFTYNRLDKTKKAIESLDKNSLAPETDFYIFSDCPKTQKDEKVQSVRNYLLSYQKNSRFRKTVLNFAPEHKGLARSVIDGVTDIIHQYGRVIVNEDDLICDANYLSFMNECLDFYAEKESVWSIAGWSPVLHAEIKDDVYVTYRGCSWGWATWADRWDTVDWQVRDYQTLKYSPLKRYRLHKAGGDLYRMMKSQKQGRIDSWAVRWCYAEALQNNRVTIYPKQSFVHNIGLDGSGTHHANSGNEEAKECPEHSYRIIMPSVNPAVLKEFNKHYAGTPFPWNYVVRIYNHFTRV